MALTHEEVIRALGPTGDVVAAAIIGSGATAEELAEARAWLANDEALINSSRALATGRIGRLIRILATIEEEDESDEPASAAASTARPGGKP